MVHKYHLNRKFQGILSVVDKAHKSIEKMQKLNYNRNMITRMQFKARNGYSRPTSISTFKRGKKTNRGLTSASQSRRKTLKNRSMIGLSQKDVKEDSKSKRGKRDSKSMSRHRPSKEVKKKSLDKLKNQLAVLESNKQNITVHILDNEKLQIQEEQAFETGSSKKSKKSKRKASRKRKKSKVKSKDKFAEDVSRDQNAMNSKVTSTKQTTIQNTQAYTNKSTTENMRNTKNSAFRMTRKDTDGGGTITSGFPRTARGSQLGRNTRENSQEAIQRNTTGNGFNIKLRDIDIKKSYREDKA